MKAILYMDEGSKVIAEFLTPPTRKARETQREFDGRMAQEFNRNQPLAVHKVVKMKILRN